MEIITNIAANSSITKEKALHCAIQAKDIALVTLLLDEGVDITRVVSIDANNHLDYPFENALIQEHVEMAKLIIDKRVEQNNEYFQRFALLELSRQCNWGTQRNAVCTTVLAYLMEKGITINAEDGTRTLLVQAVLDGYYFTVKLLVESKAKLDTLDDYSMTALMWAVQLCQEENTTLLVNAGADLNKEDKNGYTALIFGITRDTQPCVETLIGAGAPIRFVHKTEEARLRIGKIMAEWFLCYQLCAFSREQNIQLVELLANYAPITHETIDYMCYVWDDAIDYSDELVASIRPRVCEFNEKLQQYAYDKRTGIGDFFGDMASMNKKTKKQKV